MTHVVARIGKPHGVRGEVTVRLHTDEPQRRFVLGARFGTQPAPSAGAPSTLTLRSARQHNGVWLLGFEQVEDRDAAERLRGTHLLVPEETGRDESRASHDDQTEGDTGGDTEDGWYEEELLGLAVERVDGTPVGTVSGLRLGSAQDLLEVALEAGGSAYVPFVAALVPVVDLRGRRVVVDPPAGLLELNA